MYIDIRVTLLFKGKEYAFIYPFYVSNRKDIEDMLKNGSTDDGYTLWKYWWEEGNGACDCTRSIESDIADEYPDLATTKDGTFPCGDTIELLDIEPLPDTIREEYDQPA